MPSVGPGWPKATGQEGKVSAGSGQSPFHRGGHEKPPPTPFILAVVHVCLPQELTSPRRTNITPHACVLKARLLPFGL